MIELSKAEFDVLDALWINYPATASQIIERLSDDKQWHEKTIKTLLGRLVKKGALTFEKDGRQYIYTPCMERAEHIKRKQKLY